MIYLAALCMSLAPGSEQAIELQPGMVIRGSARVVAKVYEFANAADDAQSSAIRIQGDGIVVDFGGATLRGTGEDVDPDRRKGTALIVEGSNVTVKNLKARGYRIGLFARGVRGLKVLDCDFSYGYKPRLLSTLDREDGADWMSYHHNEKGEWIAKGCGAYLEDCDGFEVRNLRVIGSLNGLMLTRCDQGLVGNSNFSFLSGVGLAMYRSSANRILHNRIDWCVRGYSHGVYNRGQDSAGILVYEQSHKNVFAYNSVTHGGDGFFLWAGQTTMDTGQGGCNDNLLFGNDFSHAPTNGIEATFSRNSFVNNLILECWHGIWGGYSYDTKVIANTFGLNAEGIALEHGQDNEFYRNVFRRDLNGIVLWQNPSQDPNWGYPKNRDTSSRDPYLHENQFHDLAGTAVRLRDTKGARILGNLFGSVKEVVKVDGQAPGLQFRGNLVLATEAIPIPEGVDNSIETDPSYKPSPPLMLGSGNVIQGLDLKTEDYLARFQVAWYPMPSDFKGVEPLQGAVAPFAPRPLEGGIRPFLKAGQLRGRRYILVDEWGPYDFKSPKLWPRTKIENGEQVFEVLGPPGMARLLRAVDMKIVATSADGENWKEIGHAPTHFPTPTFLRVKYEAGQSIDRQLEFEYVGEATTDFRGRVTPAGQPVRFGYRRFHLPIDWTVKWFAYDKGTQEPRTQYEAFRKLLKEGKAIREERVQELNYAWGGAIGPGLPTDFFATLAEGTFQIPPGEYVLEVTSDDGVKVWIDDKLVIENWTWHGPTLDSAQVSLGGRHRIRIEHFEIDGYSTLKLSIRPK
ncbi:MAG: right-handed parallel beta-helix repeat-containing protein [Fimbriimonadaceae bacterium]|nr:right-handed parallel beta-helix repeat-containing protein [Fimbriimonadaceae bacterium]QOJ11193.1 MAG: right-handed parallel beta-helix repeat-containing protein [Chthonomonadaceae bacterium]